MRYIIQVDIVFKQNLVYIEFCVNVVTTFKAKLGPIPKPAGPGHSMSIKQLTGDRFDVHQENQQPAINLWADRKSVV